MAKKSDHKGEEPVGWVTVKGKHFPKWKDGTIGWENGQEEIPSKTTTKEAKKVSHDSAITDIEERLKKARTPEEFEKEKDEIYQYSKKLSADKKVDDRERNHLESRLRDLYNKADSSLVGTGKEGGLTDSEMRDKGFVVDTPITDESESRMEKRRQKMEAADEADAYDRAHGEGQYAKTTSRNAKYDTSRSNDSYFSMRHAAEEDTSRNSRSVTSLLKSKGFTRADAIAAYAKLNFTTKQSAAENIRLMSPEEVLALVQKYKRKRK